MNKPQLVVVLFLCVLTIVFYSQYERYEPAGENLLKIENFQANILCWKKECSGALIEKMEHSVTRLTSLNGQEILSIRQAVDNVKNYQSLLFSCKLRTDDVIPGEQSWQTSHIVAIGLDDIGKKQFQEPHLLIKQYGTHEWENYSKVIKLTDKIEKILVEVQLSRAVGAVWVKDISLQPVRQKNAYDTYWLIAVISWTFAIVWVVVTFFKNNYLNWHKVAISILAITVVIGSLLPYSVVTYVNDFLMTIVAPLWSKGGFFLLEWTGLSELYRQAHFWIFILLAIVLYWDANSTKLWILRSWYLGLFAVVIEILQMLVDGRNAELGDLFSDAGGIVFVLVFRAMLYAFTRFATLNIMK